MIQENVGKNNWKYGDVEGGRKDGNVSGVSCRRTGQMGFFSGKDPHLEGWCAIS